MPRNIFFFILKSYKNSNVGNKNKNSIFASSSSSSSSAGNDEGIALPNHEVRYSTEYKKHFAVISLVPPGEGEYSEFIIKETHITFFEHNDDYYDSGYHFTATIIKDSKEFKVHVFFDQDGSARVLSRDLDENGKDIILELAQKQCTPIIKSIRAYQLKRISVLTNEISRVLDLSQSTSLGAVGEIDKISTQLLALRTHTEELQSIGGSVKAHKKITSRINDLEWLKEDINRGEKLESKENKNKSSSIIASATAQDAEKEHIFSESTTRVAKIVTEICDLVRTKKTFPSSSVLLDAHRSAKEALKVLLATSKDDDGISLIDFALLEFYLRTIHAVTVAHLLNSVCNFADPIQRKETEALKHFIKYLNPSILCYSIRIKNKELLQWLLAHGSFRIEDAISKNNGKFFRALEYAYREEEIELFRVLLDHNALLYLKTMQSSKLLIEEILTRKENNSFVQEVNSPERKILRAEQLINLFKICLSNFKLSPSNIDKIETLINRGNTFIAIAQSKSKKNQKRFDEFFNIFMTTYQEILKEQEINAIFDRVLKDQNKLKESVAKDPIELLQEVSKQSSDLADRLSVFASTHMPKKELQSEVARVAANHL